MKTWIRADHFLSLFQLMETTGTSFLSDSDSRAPVSPLHLAVSVFMWLLVSLPLMIWFSAVKQKSVLSVALGLPWALWRFRGSPVIPAGSGRLQPWGSDPTQLGQLQGPSGVCLSAAAPWFFPHDPGLHTQKDSHTCRRYLFGHTDMLMLSYGFFEISFLSATAMNGHQECLRLLISSNTQHIDVDAQDVNGQWVCVHGQNALSWKHWPSVWGVNFS